MLRGVKRGVSLKQETGNSSLHSINKTKPLDSPKYNYKRRVLSPGRRSIPRLWGDASCGGSKKSVGANLTKKQLFNQGTSYRKIGEWERAEEYFKKALDIDPKFHAARVEYAAMLFNLRDDELSKAELQKVLSNDPSNIDAKALSAFFLIYSDGNRDYEKAITILKGVLTVNPDHIKANYYLGIAYELKKDNKNASLYFDRVVSLGSDNIVFLANIAGFYIYSLNNDDKAFEIASDILKKDSNNFVALKVLGEIHYYRNEYRGAMPLLLKALEKDPTSSSIYGKLGTIYQSRGEYKKALSYFKRHVSLDPESHLAHGNLGECLNRLKRYAEAEEELKKAIAIEPDYKWHYAEFGDALYRQKNMRKLFMLMIQRLR